MVSGANTGLSGTPTSERIHIALFGKRNAGKSSLINAISGQDVALVSPVPGTTTDPVQRPMELHGAGPVVFIDTPGLDDEGELGRARVSRTMRVLRKTDIALVVVDATTGPGELESELVETLQKRSIPLVLVMNKADMVGARRCDFCGSASGTSDGKIPVVWTSAVTGQGISELVAILSAMAKSRIFDERPIVGDLINPGDVVILVVPVDLEAPKGRLILPQVQTIRDILDHGGCAVVTRADGLQEMLAKVSDPRLVVTDSQAFDRVSKVVPQHIPLTSFSILFARYKGDLPAFVRGLKALESLRSGDRVLIAEACTHHPIEDDIGTAKIPALLRKKTGADIDFSWCRGVQYPDDVSGYKVIIHCGGCMLNRREMLSRVRMAEEAGVPITNYGMTIAWCLGIAERALAPLWDSGGGPSYQAV